MKVKYTNKATLFINNGLVQVKLQEQTGERSYKDIIKRVTLKRSASLNIISLLSDKSTKPESKVLKMKISRKLHCTADLYTAVTATHVIVLDSTTSQVIFADIKSHVINVSCVKLIKKNNLGTIYNGDVISTRGKLKDTKILNLNNKPSIDSMLNQLSDLYQVDREYVEELFKLHYEPKLTRISVASTCGITYEIEATVLEANITGTAVTSKESDIEQINLMIRSLAVNHNRDLLKSIKPLIEFEHIIGLEKVVKILEKGMVLLPDRFTIEKIIQQYPLMYNSKNIKKTEMIIVDY